MNNTTKKALGVLIASVIIIGLIAAIGAAMLDETDKAESWQAFAESAKPLIDSEITKYNK